MKRAIPIATLFLDVGGVLFTDGWDHHARNRADKLFVPAHSPKPNIPP